MNKLTHFRRDGGRGRGGGGGRLHCTRSDCDSGEHQGCWESQCCDTGIHIDYIKTGVPTLGVYLSTMFSHHTMHNVLLLLLQVLFSFPKSLPSLFSFTIPCSLQHYSHYHWKLTRSVYGVVLQSADRYGCRAWW